MRDILKENNILIKDIDVIGVNIGPGSFTGIRAGLTIARVLAQQYNIKLCAVNSLKILSKLNKTEKRTVTIVEPSLILKEDIEKNIKNDDFIISDNSISEYLSGISIQSYNYEKSDENLACNLMEITETEAANSDCNWAKVKPLYIQPPSITLPKKDKIEVKNV